ncbi:hypothetical protein GW915_00340 [bacterium]|nr:hypothetical protein [bacterium]
MKTAIKPNFFVNVPSLEKSVSVEGVTEEENALYAMSKTAGWKVFKDMASRVTLELNNINKVAISQGLPLDEIGRNAIVVNLAQEVIEKLLNRVADAEESCEKNG